MLLNKTFSVTRASTVEDFPTLGSDMYRNDGTFIQVYTRVVPDTDFEPGYTGFEKPDSDIRPDIRRLPDTGYPVFPIGFLIFFSHAFMK